MIEPLNPLSHLRPFSKLGHEELAVSWKLLPERNPTVFFDRFDELAKANGPRELGDGRTLVVHHPTVRPPVHSGLVVMTYNILLGGLRREALDKYFAQSDQAGLLPDVIGLQEATVPTAARLASEHGFHLAYFGRDMQPGRHVVNGKAVLSRFPLLEAEHFTYGLDELEREAIILRRGEVGELDEDRGALRVVLDVRGCKVAVYNVHHALGDSGINANNLRQLNVLLHAYRDEHALVMGDFNANTAIHQSTHWIGGRLHHKHETHSVQSYRKRYGHVVTSVGDSGVGNIADPRVRHELHLLERRFPDVFHHSERVLIRRRDGSVMTPDQARARLDPDRLAKGCEAWQRLQDVADASTLNPDPDSHGVIPATGKRFDNIFASQDMKSIRVEVDRSTLASDHTPVLVELHLA